MCQRNAEFCSTRGLQFTSVICFNYRPGRNVSAAFQRVSGLKAELYIYDIDIYVYQWLKMTGMCWSNADPASAMSDQHCANARLLSAAHCTLAFFNASLLNEIDRRCLPGLPPDLGRLLAGGSQTMV